jgi:hypothetical protein
MLLLATVVLPQASVCVSKKKAQSMAVILLNLHFANDFM